MTRFEDEMDPVVETAIAQLADVLHARLRTSVDEASSRCFDRVEQELQKRSGDIDTATQRFVQVLRSLGEDMKKQTCIALDDGVSKHVIPVLAEQAQHSIELTEKRIATSFSQLEQLVAAAGTSIRRAELELHASAKANMDALCKKLEFAQRTLQEALSEAQEAAKNQAQDGITNLSGQLDECAKVARQHLQELELAYDNRTKLIQLDIEKTHERLSRAVAVAEKRIGERQEHNAASTNARFDEASTLATKGRAELSEMILGAFREATKHHIRQELFLKRLWYISLTIAVAVIGILVTALLLCR